MNLPLYLTFCFSTFVGYLSPVCQVLPSARSTDWSFAGYSGSIPGFNRVVNIIDFGGANDGRSPNDVALQSAISALSGTNGVIYFPAGTYLFGFPATLRSGLVLKGDDAGNTLLQFNLQGAGDLLTAAGNAVNETIPLAATAAKGVTAIRLTNTNQIKAGDYIKLFENDAPLVHDAFASGSVGQILYVQNVSGDSVFFAHPLRRAYALQNTPQIREINMVSNVGIECLRIKRMDSTAAHFSNIFFSYAANCWVTGVESDSCNFAHIRIAGCTNIEVKNSYFHGAFSYGANGEGYGISCEYTSGECLVENNIFRHLRHSMLLQSGANGNVLDYNYSFAPSKSEGFPSDLSGDIVLHGNYPYLNLVEGNIVQNIFVDASHGINGPFNSFLRNRAESYGIVISQGAGDSTNLLGNEITGRGQGRANYLLNGSGNFEYGNNRNNSYFPPASTGRFERSLKYDSVPTFWNVAGAWPAIGRPSQLGAGTIPAKQRFEAGTGASYCLPAVPVLYKFNGNGSWSDAVNWLDRAVPPPVLSAGSEIVIDPEPGGRCVLDRPYTVNPASKLTVAPGKNFVVNGTLTILH